MEIPKTVRGFTLIELMIVIAIIGVISGALTLVNWSPTQARLSIQTTLLSQDIRYTQSLSVSRNERYRLIITSQANYTIQDSAGNLQPIPSTSNQNGTLLPNITFVSPTSYTLIFDSKGVPYDGSTTPETELTSNLVITLKNTTGQSSTINITPIAGRVY